MRDAAQPEKVMYSFGYESRARALNGFAEMFERPDFEERRAKLVAGLDAESVSVVDQILRRLKVVLGLKAGEQVDLYTEAEQKALDDAKRELQDKIVQLAPDLFVWNGYALPSRHFEANVFLDGYGFRFLETLGDIGDRAIIDAGAFIGDSALMLAPLTSGKVFAFEPMAENFGKLEKTIWLNGLRNVVPVHAALGDRAGTLTMTIGDVGACATVQNKLPGDGLKQETVATERLDDFVRRKGVAVGLIKTDVEGAEQMLLRGAIETIRRDRPILLISIYHNASDFLDIKPMIESWKLGYRFRIYHPPIKSISGETVLIAECIRRGERRRSGSCIVPELQSANRSVLKVCAEAVALRNAKLAERDAARRKAMEMRAERDAARRKAMEMRAERDAQREAAQLKIAAAQAERDAARRKAMEMRAERDAQREMAQQKIAAAQAERDASRQKAAEMRAERDAQREMAQQKIAAAQAERDAARQKTMQMRELRDEARSQILVMREQRDKARSQANDRQKLICKLREVVGCIDGKEE